MATRITHRAKIIAMDLTIQAMKHTRSSGLLRTLVQKLYALLMDGYLLLWVASMIACGLAGFLIGYLAFFLFP